MFRLLWLVTAMLILPVTASAQVLIIGGGAGKDCYQAVKFNLFPSQADEKTCTEAIQSASLDRESRAATFINRGIVRMRRGDYVASLEDYAKAEQLTPNAGALFLNRGAALIGTGQYDNALASLQKALDLETQDTHAAHYNMGIAQELLGEVELAYKSYQTALELKPDWALASNALERFTVLRD